MVDGMSSRLYVERTTSVDAVRAIVDRAEIRAATVEGGFASVPMHPKIYCLLAKEELFGDGAVYDATVGVVAFLPLNSITWNPHVAILPEHRGCGTEALAAAVEWMFANTECRKIFASPPEFNVAMIRVFEKCGFSIEGISPKSYRWHGQVHDRLLMGKEAVCGVQ